MFAALCAACQAYALENNYIKEREVRREAQREQDLTSAFVGQIGERVDFEATIISSFVKNEWDGFHVNRLRVGNDILVYLGKKLGEKHEIIKFRATIKSHDTYQGINTTRINRPTILKD